jgi:hypothetical protein
VVQSPWPRRSEDFQRPSARARQVNKVIVLFRACSGVDSSVRTIAGLFSGCMPPVSAPDRKTDLLNLAE